MKHEKPYRKQPDGGGGILPLLVPLPNYPYQRRNVMHSERLLILLVLTLTGCAHETKIPIPTTCVVKLPVKPVWCHPVDTTRPEWLRCSLINEAHCRGYALELEALLKGCMK
jgi:hypothetical protein